MSRRLMILLAVLALAVGVLTPVAAGAADPDTSDLTVPSSALDAIKAAKTDTYIVQMLGDPVVAYDGDVKGYPATEPKPGKKINPNSANVKKYAKHLVTAQDAALADVGGGEKIYSYVYAYNGFAAVLTGTQASDLSNRSDVLAVSIDTMSKPDTVSTPSFLEMDASGGIWDQLGGFDSAGEDVIVGIVDTGIWIESASFSDRVDLTFQPGNSSDKPGKGKKELAYGPAPADWHGICQQGESFGANYCNNKVIGARYFMDGYTVQGIQLLGDYKSPRDGDGHGSHTASTAAGNYGVPVTIDGVDFGPASGMAPRARIAAYKVCWGGDAGGCFSSDSVAAIDQAVADGVDIINFSISGSRTSLLDPVEVAFLFAADAGIFVAASAGNSGPGASTVAHNSPWLTTVAAGTHNRFYAGEAVTNEDPPKTYTGAMLAGTSVNGDLVYAGNVGSTTPVLDDEGNYVGTEGELCFPDSLDASEVQGKIVLCDRGVIARVDKSAEVSRAGGIGMIHANTGPGSINADLHAVPTLHVDATNGAPLRAYAQTPDAYVTLSGGELQSDEAPAVAAFSSRGPALASSDLLKPDIMAPGVDILAAVAPPFYGGHDYDSLSGTSMSSPHMAGIAALMKDMYPDWSPMMIKSSLMTTASQDTNMGHPISGDAFDFGAGHVAPNSATDPGLVYNAGWIDWLGFLCGTGQLQAPYCPAIGFDPSNLNYPSITVGDLAGSQTITRTVTNVGDAATYNVSVDAPPGIDVKVSPSTLALANGESADYEVTFTTVSAPIGAYAFGSLTWSDGMHSVRSPLTVRPVQLAAAAEIHKTGLAGSLSYEVKFGYSGAFTTSTKGLVPADMQADMVVDDPANDINTALATGVGITMHAVTVPAGSELARFSLFDVYTDGKDDLDLYVFDPSFGFAGGSGSGTSEEEVNITSPAPGTWYVIVHGWQTDGPDSNYTLFSWAFGADTGKMTVTAPASATLGTVETITVDWSGLDAGTRYLGAVGYSDGTEFGSTIIRIDTD